MFSSRVLSILFFLVSFGLFVYAKPIDTSALAARSAELAPRCGCTIGEVKEILVDLDVKVKAAVVLISKSTDKVHDPVAVIADIIVDINAAVALLAKIRLSVCDIGVVLAACVHICVSIILAICIAITECGVEIKAEVIAHLDVALKALVAVLISCCPAIGGLIAAVIKVYLHVCVEEGTGLFSSCSFSLTQWGC
ncbi:uncharacterized protein EI90DRAFT_1026528 [Cantharellus anzutake]|uniref:uncharacterized protein n=1 Tax=Cantharellus anzutake TaxID=1750568 RepID=UPI001902DFAC|nr:uncharacterized protein EI90DRAFT_1026528 [Cantharellus anzutake]KAF8331486.1 hypothetical protein EI90DRAFT_1026528 [Cantharellus anzutake]